jgi:hypothetical protein
MKFLLTSASLFSKPLIELENTIGGNSDDILTALMQTQ